jgi:YD repeat-containing protein
VPAPDELNAVICPRLKLEAPLWKLDTGSSGLTGYYRAAASSQNPALFIKVVEQARAAPLLAADPFARFADDQGVAAACLNSVYTKLINEDLFALAYPYCEARFASTDTNDLARLGLALSRLHQALAKAPFQASVQQNASERHALIGDTLKRLDTLDTRTLPQTAIELLRHAPVRYPETGWQAQIIHGDLNYGNVLFPIQHLDPPVFLDFEDTVLAWHSPLVDIAFVIERFILIHNQNDATAYAHAETLLRAYLSGFPTAPPAIEKGCLGKMLQSLSARALGLLVAITLDNNTVTQYEWDKFQFLYTQTRKRKELISKIEGLLRR